MPRAKKSRTDASPPDAIEVSAIEVAADQTAPDSLDFTAHNPGGKTDDGALDQIPPATFPRFFIQRQKKKKNYRRDNTSFHKPNPLVHNKPQAVMTVTQQKLTNVLLRHAQHNVPVGDATWKIAISEVLNMLNVQTRNTVHLDKTIEEMMSIKVRMDIFEEHGIAKHFAVVFPYAKLYAGEITFKIEREAINLLTSNNSYTNLDLSELSNLSKVCSVPLYEFGSRYLGIGASRWVAWEDLRDMLVAAKDIPKKAMQWASFNERYLSPAIKDINASTKLYIELETERIGTKVSKVRVLVSRQQNSLDLTASTVRSETKKALQDAMLAMGMLEKAIHKTMSAYSEEEIDGALKHTYWRVKESKLRKLTYPSRFFLASLKAGYYKDHLQNGTLGHSGELFPVADGNLPEVPALLGAAARPATTPRSTKAKPDKLAGGRAKLQAAVQKQRIMDVKIILAEMPKPQLLELYAQYNATLSSALLHIKPGRNRAGVLPTFQSWYAKHLWNDITDAEIVKTMERMLSAQGD